MTLYFSDWRIVTAEFRALYTWNCLAKLWLRLLQWHKELLYVLARIYIGIILQVN